MSGLVNAVGSRSNIIGTGGLANMVGYRASGTSTLTGWSEYTSVRGRMIVGLQSGGADAGTVGTAYTTAQDKSKSIAHTHDMRSHTHDMRNHTHDMRNHTHDMRNHTHDMRNHTHTLDHNHALPADMVMNTTGTEYYFGATYGTHSRAGGVGYISKTGTPSGSKTMDLTATSSGDSSAPSLNTSDVPSLNTSDAPSNNTSDTPSLNTSDAMSANTTVVTSDILAYIQLMVIKKD